MVAADHFRSINARGTENAKLIRRIDFETVRLPRHIARRMQGTRRDHVAAAFAFDQPATLARKRRPRFSLQLRAKRRRQPQDVHCLFGGVGRADVTRPTKRPSSVLTMSISSPSDERTCRIKRPG